ncbi:MAG: zinc ribbon domain-containing protein, partial [Methyloprofundus sp.]|nr:zinc ribbon domain-containing protein [Methyloprofundus sp.]
LIDGYIIKAYQATPYLFEIQQNLGTYFARLIPNRHRLCTRCAQSIQSNAAFCWHCGHKAQERSRCTTCGQMLSADQKFCAHCGTEKIE